MSKPSACQRKGHADYGGQTEANLDNFSELFGPVHIQAENQCPQDSKHNEESPAKACKFVGVALHTKDLLQENREAGEDADAASETHGQDDIGSVPQEQLQPIQELL